MIIIVFFIAYCTIKIFMNLKDITLKYIELIDTAI